LLLRLNIAVADPIVEVGSLVETECLIIHVDHPPRRRSKPLASG
jgi:hypothetical protein